jgi:hypothetical protein
MEVKIKEDDLKSFLEDYNIGLETITFLSIDIPVDAEEIYVDLNTMDFNKDDIRVTIIGSDVDKELSNLSAKKAQEQLTKKMFNNNGVVKIANGKEFYMDQNSRIDILSSILISLVNPELTTDTISWKTPNGVVDVTLVDLTEALLTSMHERKKLVGL